METKLSLHSPKQFKPEKGVPNIPYKSRPLVPTDWTDEIERLEKFFAGIVLPVGDFKINPWTTTTDLSFCIESGLNYLRTNNGNRTFYPYLEELLEIELILLPEREREVRKALLMPKPIESITQKVKRENKPKNSVRKAKPSTQIPKCDLWDYQSFYFD